MTEVRTQVTRQEWRQAVNLALQIKWDVRAGIFDIEQERALTFWFVCGVSAGDAASRIMAEEWTTEG